MKRSTLTTLAWTAVLILLTQAWSAEAASQTAPASPSPGKIADLAWMAGSWSGSQGPLEMEEHWTAPKGGSMLGVHRDVKGGRTVSFEYARIEESAEGVVYQASPGGKPATPFRLAKLEGKKAVFENPEHDFPQRVLYWLEPDGSLSARIEGTINGKEESEQWTWRPSSLK